MSVNVVKVRKLREQKLFSQEKLAIAFGIGLRTLQRLEVSGTA